MRSDDVTHLKADPLDLKILLAIIGFFALCIAWQLSDREPRSKEMTFAYRKHFESTFRDLSSAEQVRIRNRNHAIELNKLACQKIEDNRYRCDADVLVNNKPDRSHPQAEHGIYTHDFKGWRYEDTPA